MLQFEWKLSQESIDWEELSDLYKVAPLGDKKPEDLKNAFSNSMFKCFIFESGDLVGVGRALADGVDVFSYESGGTELNVDGTDDTALDATGYGGDIIALQMEVATTAGPGALSPETLTFSYDEI